MAKGDKLSFVSSKTEQEAKAVTSGGAIHFTNDTHRIFMDGEMYGGMTDEQKDMLLTQAQKDYLNGILQDQIINNYVVSVKSSASTVTPGTNITFTITTKYSGTAVKPDSISAKYNGNTVQLSNSSTGTYTYTTAANTGSCQLSVSTTYTAEGIAIDKSASATTNVRNLIKYCWASVDTLTAANMNTVCKNNNNQVGFETKTITTSAKGTYTWTNANTGYYFLLIPQTPAAVTTPTSLTGSNPQGVEGPLPVYFVKQSDNVTYDGVTYTIFRIKDEQVASTHTITFN